MSVRIVIVFEKIDINHDQGKHRGMPLITADFPVELLHEIAVIEEIG